jgi:deoxyribodipyrimidine photo-lyase
MNEPYVPGLGDVLAIEAFPPSREAALARLRTADLAGYAERRNHLDGPVTRLSPYISHGVISVPEIVAALRAAGAQPRHRLIFELAWREYWQHVWRHLGIGILQGIRRPVSRAEYANALPRDVLEARSGVRVIDAAVRGLYETGYIHNHARMWVASYLVHLRKVHWRAGADWLYSHLLDGDLASNHLSWQWVAGTFSTKPYLFNRENVERYAPGLGTPGSAIDRSYAELEQLARSTERIGPEHATPMRAVSAPALAARPSEREFGVVPDTIGRDVVLVHPWMLEDRRDGEVAIGVLHLPFHEAFPWSTARWAFVMARMRRVTDVIWAGDLRELVGRLHGSRAVRSVATLYPGYRDVLESARIRLEPPPRAFGDPEILCQSFTEFWRLVRPAQQSHETAEAAAG